MGKGPFDLTHLRRCSAHEAMMAIGVMRCERQLLPWTMVPTIPIWLELTVCHAVPCSTPRPPSISPPILASRIIIVSISVTVPCSKPPALHYSTQSAGDQTAVGPRFRWWRVMKSCCSQLLFLPVPFSLLSHYRGNE